MAVRYARRAKISGEGAVTISFGFSSITIAIIAGVLEELPYVGLLFALLFFHFHRPVLVTDQHMYVYRDLPFHQPGTHSPLFAWRVRQVAEAVWASGAAGPA